MASELQRILEDVQKNHLSKTDAAELIKKLKPSMESPLNEAAGTSFGANLFTQSFAYNEPYLQAHQVFGEQVVLGLTHCSVAVETARKINPDCQTIQLHKFLFREPIVVSALETVELKTSVSQQGERKLITNYFKKSSQSDYHVTTITECHFPFLRQQNSVVPSEVAKEFGPLVSREEMNRKRLLAREPGLQTVQNAYLRGNEAFGEMNVSAELAYGAGYYGVHPALLDGGFIISLCGQTDQVLLEDDPAGMWVPFMIKDIYVQGTLSGRCFCHGKVTKVNSRILVIDFTIYNEAGEAVVVVNEFTHKYTVREEFFRHSFTPKLMLNPASDRGAADQPGLEQAQPSFSNSELRPQIAEYLASKIKQRLQQPSQRLADNQNFMDMGVDSNHFVFLAQEIEQELGIELYPTLFFEYQNIKELVEYFESNHYVHLLKYLNVHHSATGEAGGELPEDFQRPRAQPADTEPVTIGVEQAGLRLETTGLPSQAVHPSFTPEFRDNGTGNPDAEAIAIIGMAGRFAKSANLNEFWQNLKAARDLITEVPVSRWDWRKWYDQNREATNKTYCKWGSFIEVDRFDPLFFGITPREAVWMDPQLRILMEVIHETIEDAGCGQKIYGSDTAVFVGASLREYWEQIVQAQVPFVDYQASSSILSSLAGRISYTFDLQGMSIPLDTACASSLTAMHLACKALQSQQCEMAFVAGACLLLSHLHYVYVSRMQALSPSGKCHTFDQAADGYVPGEGVAAVLLKPLSKALRDHDRIYAVIKGTAVNHVGKANNPTAPRPELQTKLLLDAWKDAGINPETLTYLEAHGTGTRLGDPIEVSALKKAFDNYTNKKNFCAIGSVKAQIGHLGPAAGLAGVIKTVLAMRNKVIPVMPNFNTLNPYIGLEDSPFYINRAPMEWQPEQGLPRRAGISSFGLTGNNAHVVLEEYLPAPEPYVFKSPQAARQIFVLSARNDERLKAYAELYRAFLEEKDPETGVTKSGKPTLAEMVFSLQVGREAMEERLALLVSDLDELHRKLTQYCQGQENIAGCYHGSIHDKSKVGNILEGEEGQVLIKSLMQREKVGELAQLWVSGVNINWRLLYTEPLPALVSLPTYPFRKESYWIPETLEGESPIPGSTVQRFQEPLINSPSVKKETVSGVPGECCASFCYLPVWRPVAQKPEPDTKPGRANRCNRVLVVCTTAGGGLTEALQRAHRTDEVSVINLEQADGDVDLTPQVKQVDRIYFMGGMIDRDDRLLESETAVRIQERGVLALFRLVKLLCLAGRTWDELVLKIITNNVYRLGSVLENIPYSASLHGFAQSLAKEFPKWQVSCIDLPLEELPVELAANAEPGLFKQVLEEPGNPAGTTTVFRNGKRYHRVLEPVALPSEAAMPFNREGVYLLAGGAGAVGLELAFYLARTVQARLVLTGRSELNEGQRERIAKIESAGGKVLYIRADVTNIEQMREAVGTVKSVFGRINGVFQMVMVMQNNAIENMDEATFKRVLEPKVNGSVVLCQVLKDEPLDFMVFFSSCQSLLGEAGMCNYVAGNSFEDAWVEHLSHKTKYPVKVINWGYLGRPGLEILERDSLWMKTQGYILIPPEEWWDVLVKFLGTPFTQIVPFKAEAVLLESLKRDWEYRNVVLPERWPSIIATTLDIAKQPLLNETEWLQIEQSHDQLEQLSYLLLVQAFQRMGVLLRCGEQYSKADLREQLRIIPVYHQLFEVLLQVLVRSGFVSMEADQITTTRVLEQVIESGRLDQLAKQYERLMTLPEARPFVKLLWICMEQYPAILQGEVPATDIMFPGSSMDLMKDIYTGNILADHYNNLVVWSLLLCLKERIPALKPGEKIKILEIGAGTGGTSTKIFDAICGYQAKLVYTYSDISGAFVQYGRQKYGVNNPYVEFKVLNIEKDLGEQHFALGDYDVIIATNVLHATREIKQTLSRAKSLLKRNGWLIMNEATGLKDFGTIMYGLLEGWWLFEDQEERLPGCPLLSVRSWERILEEVGYKNTAILGRPAPEGKRGGQHVIVTESNGWVRVRANQAVPDCLVGLPQPFHSAIAAKHPFNPAMGMTGRTFRAQDTENAGIAEQIKRILVEVLQVDGKELLPNAPFIEFGVDSILAIEIVQRINQETGFNLRTTDLFNYASIKKLVEYITTQYGPQIAEVKPPDHERVNPALQKTRVEKAGNQVQMRIVTVLSQVLQINSHEFGPDDPYTSFGVDSILAIEIVKRLNADLGIELKSTDLFNYSSVRTLTGYIMTRFGQGINDSSSLEDRVPITEQGLRLSGDAEQLQVDVKKANVENAVENQMLRDVLQKLSNREMEIEEAVNLLVG